MELVINEHGFDYMDNWQEKGLICVSDMSDNTVLQTRFASTYCLAPTAYRNFKLPDEGETWQRCQRWYAAMLGRPAFRKTAFDQADYEKRLVEHYVPYSQGGGSTHVTRTN